MSTPPKVFISYSHDSALQMDLVLALSNRLRGDGIDCNIDQYEESPAKGWSTWMLDEMEAAKFVLVVCNEAYYRRFRKQEEAGKGKGVIWESGLMTMDIYNAQGKNEKFIPITFQEGNDPKFVPDPLRDFTKYALQSNDGYDKLLYRLREENKKVKPPLGLQSRDRKQDFSTQPQSLGLVDAENSVSFDRQGFSLEKQVGNPLFIS